MQLQEFRELILQKYGRTVKAWYELPGEALMDMDTSGLENGNFRKSSAGMGGIHERGIEYLQPLARFQLLNYLPCVVEELLFSWTCANFESFSSKWWTIWVQIVNLPGRSWPRWLSHSQSFGPQENPSISPSEMEPVNWVNNDGRWTFFFDLHLQWWNLPPDWGGICWTATVATVWAHGWRGRVPG